LCQVGREAWSCVARQRRLHSVLRLRRESGRPEVGFGLALALDWRPGGARQQWFRFGARLQCRLRDSDQVQWFRIDLR
jgi:hypothetical protein